MKIYKSVFCDRQRAKFNFLMMTRTSTSESRLSPRRRGEDKGEEFKPIHDRSTLTLPCPLRRERRLDARVAAQGPSLQLLAT